MDGENIALAGAKAVADSDSLEDLVAEVDAHGARSGRGRGRGGGGSCYRFRWLILQFFCGVGAMRVEAGAARAEGTLGGSDGVVATVAQFRGLGMTFALFCSRVTVGFETQAFQMLGY